MRNIAKRRILLNLSILVIAATSFSANSADSAELYDVAQFELGGLKQGDTIDEARQALAQFYSFDPADLESKYDDRDVMYEHTGQRNVEDELRYRSEDLNLTAKFAPNKNAEGRWEMILMRLEVSPDLDATEERREFQQSMAEMYVEKYGPATFVESSGYSHKWCTKINRRGTGCDWLAPFFEVSNRVTSLRFMFPTWEL